MQVHLPEILDSMSKLSHWEGSNDFHNTQNSCHNEKNPKTLEHWNTRMNFLRAMKTSHPN